MRPEQWQEYLKKSNSWFVRIGFDLLHSEAYKELNYAPAIKVLNWFYEKVRVQVNKGKRGKRRYKVLDGDVSFTYREAILRGLSSQQFSKALKELHRLGFIDVIRAGSALKGDWTQFAFSERWKDFGTSAFKYSEYPQSVHWVNFGFGANRKKKRES